MSGATTTRVQPTITRGRLNALLSRHLPAPLTEILLPAIRWRLSRNSVTAVLPNSVWEDLFRDTCLPVFAQHPLPGLNEVLVMARIDSDETGAARPLTFESLLIDPGNEFVVSSARQVLDAPGLAHNPLVLYGPPGCGKTHILHALGHEFGDCFTSEAAVQFSGEDWVRHLSSDLAERADSPLQQRLDEAVAVLVDDIHLLADRSMAQERFFNVLKNCLENGQQVVLTAPVPPKRLQGFEDRLLTRFGAGLQMPIEMPQLETRMAFLRILVGSLLDDLDDRQLGDLVEGLAPDMHQVRIIADRFLAGEKITLGGDSASFDLILDTVASHYDLRAGDIAGKRRHRQVTLARQTALLLGRRLTAHSLEALGGMVGGRDHSTVLYLIRQARTRAEEDDRYRRLLAELTQQVLRR